MIDIRRIHPDLPGPISLPPSCLPDALMYNSAMSRISSKYGS